MDEGGGRVVGVVVGPHADGVRPVVQAGEVMRLCEGHDRPWPGVDLVLVALDPGGGIAAGPERRDGGGVGDQTFHRNGDADVRGDGVHVERDRRLQVVAGPVHRAHVHCVVALGEGAEAIGGDAGDRCPPLTVDAVLIAGDAGAGIAAGPVDRNDRGGGIVSVRRGGDRDRRIDRVDPERHRRRRSVPDQVEGLHENGVYSVIQTGEGVGDRAALGRPIFRVDAVLVSLDGGDGVRAGPVDDHGR